MRKINELTSTDFSIVDCKKFDEWKQFQIIAERKSRVAAWVLIILSFVLILVPPLGLLTLLLLIPTLYFFRRKPLRMLKELGLSYKDIARARRNVHVLHTVELTKKCPRCAEKIKAEALFCRFCGHGFSQEEVQQQISIVRQETQSAFTESELQDKRNKTRRHLSVLRILFYITSAFTFLLAFAGVGGLIKETNAGDRTLAIGFIILGLLSMVLFIIAAWNLGKKKPWAHTLTIILGICSLFVFPLGTALGVYILIVMFSEEGKKAFSNASEEI